MTTKTEALASLLKNPAVGNGGTGILVALLGILAVNPDLSPFAYADHDHDIAAVQAVVTETVKAESLRTFIEVATREIDDYTVQIQLKLCIVEGCAYEKAQQERAKNRKGDLEKALDRLEVKR